MLKFCFVNFKSIAKVSSTIVGSIYAVLGFIGVLVPLDEMLPQSLSIWAKILVSCIVLIAAWVLCFVVVAIILSKKKRFELIAGNNGHSLYVQYGDLFSAEEVMDSATRRNIVIPVNCCFDTIVDNKLVSETTLHGILFKRLFSSGKYTAESLNQALQQQLNGLEFELLTETEKPAGNLKRFPIGTVIDFSVSENEHFFLWALSTFDNKLKAQTSMQHYAIAVQRLIEACNSESEGFPIVIPLVGTGLSRTKKDQCDILAYLVNAFRLNKSEINSDIHIVVQEKLKNVVPIIDIN